MNKQVKAIKKTFKRKNKMSKRSSLAGFAMMGLAAGAAAWYFFGTKDGRKCLDKAMETFNDFSSTVKEKANEGMERASEYADKAKSKAKKKYAEGKEKLEDAANTVKNKANRLKDDAEDLGRKAAHSAADLADDAANKANKY